MIKVLKLFFLSTFTLILMVASLEVCAASVKSKDTVVWQAQWASYFGKVMPATFVQLNDSGKYSATWLSNPAVTGYINMTTTPNSFEGLTYAQTNGDACTLSGVIHGTSANGTYYCRGGDHGNVSALITAGNKATN